MFRPAPLVLLLASAFAGTAAQAGIDLIAIGSLNQAADLSGLTGMLENGVDRGNVLGGIGSGLAWAGGNTFLALPDRGPNATSWTGSAAIDSTTSYVGRWQTLSLDLNKSASGSLPYTLTPTLNSTTLLYSNTALNYGAVTSANNTADKFYFNGRSDNFAVGNSLNANNARLDPEAIRVSNDGRSVFVSDEYGPYVYQFDRATGARIKSFELPANLAVTNLSSVGATEISGNSFGRVANKGMEGLAITPDGNTLYGFMQSALLQDGGDGARYNRIVQIDVKSGAVKQFAYDNLIAGKSYNSSELLAINDHQFLVLERDGKGLGAGNSAAIKQLRLVDLAGANDISALTGEAAITASGNARAGSLFLDIYDKLSKSGISAANIPAKIEGATFGADIVDGGVTYHTLYLANDNDFVPGSAGANKFFVFRFSDADLGALGVSSFANQNISAVPEPSSYALMLGGLGLVGWMARRRQR